MGFGAYLKTRLVDFLFCLLASAGLTYTVFSGFYATQPLQQLVWPAVAPCALVLAILICIAYNLRSAIVGGVLLAMAVAGALALCAANNPGATLVDDAEGNYALAVLAVVAVSLLVFLLSRRYFTAIALVVIGVLVCALIEYLYWYGHVVALMVFLVGAMGLVVLKGYVAGLSQSDTEQLAFMSVSVTVIVMALLALLVGFGVYKLAVEPIGPARAQVTLIVQHKRIEEVKIVGTGSMSGDMGGDSGNEANDDEEQTNREASDFLRDTFDNGIRSVLGIDIDDTGDEGTTTSLALVSYLALFVVLLVAALIAAVIAIRKLVRRHRFKKLVGGGGALAVRNLYLFFLSRFERMKIPHPANLTPLEYYDGFKSTFTHFERFPAPSGATFGTLTDIYVRTTFGDEQPSDGEMRAFTDYYQVFYKNARRYVGRFKYLFKFFRL